MAPRVDADQRSRYTHQAYDVTYGGRPMESGGVAGYGARLSATYQANFQVTIPVDEVASHLFMLPPGVYCNKYVVVEGGGGAPQADLAVADPADIPGTATQIAAAVPLGATMAADAALTNNIDVEMMDQVLQVDVTIAGTGYATLLLKCDIVQTAWK